MNIDDLSTKINEVRKSFEGKDKLVYLVYRTVLATLDIYRRDRRLRAFSKYIENIRDQIKIKRYYLKRSNNNFLIVFNFDYDLLPASCSRQQKIIDLISEITRSLISINNLEGLTDVQVATCTQHILKCYSLIKILDTNLISVFNQGIFDLSDSLMNH